MWTRLKNTGRAIYPLIDGHSALCPMQGRSFVQRDVVALVALDFILRLVLAGV